MVPDRPGQRRPVPSARRSHLPAASAPPAPFTGSLYGLPTETVFGMQIALRRHRPATEQHRPAQIPGEHRSTMSPRAIPASMPSRRYIGPTGCGPPRAGAAIISQHRSTRSCSRPIPGTPKAASAARSSPSCWARSTRPNSSSALGMGYHSNDARGVTITEDAGQSVDSAAPLTIAGALPRRRGRRPHQGRAGPRQFRQRLLSCDQNSELFFDGDTGDTVPGLPSQRTGIEITNDYRPVSWVHIDANLASPAPGSSATMPTRSRSINRSPDIRRRRSATRPAITSTTRRGWWPRPASRWARRPAGSARCAGAIISSRPLTEDGAFLSPPLNIFNGRLGYTSTTAGASSSMRSISSTRTTDQANYAYGSLLKSDSLFAMC